MLDKILSFGKKEKKEQEEIIEEIEEAVENNAIPEEGEEPDKEAEERTEEKEKSRGKAKGKGRLNKKLIAIAVGSVIFIGGALLMLGGEDEDYYAPPPEDTGMGMGNGQPPMGQPAGQPPMQAPMPPPPPVAQGGGQTFQPGVESSPVPPPPQFQGQPPPPPTPMAGGVPPQPPQPQVPPGVPGATVGSSPVVQQVQKRVADNPFIIKQVDRLVREAIQRVLEEEREKIRKEIEALKGEKTSSLPSKGPITIGMPGETPMADKEDKEEVTIPSFTNAIVVSSIVKRGGETIMLSNVGVIKKGLTIGDGWKVLEVEDNHVVLEKEYYELEGTKKVKKKKVEVVPFVFDFSVKPG